MAAFTCVTNPVGLAFAAWIVATSPALAERQYGPGVTDDAIKIGQTMPYSGPVSAWALWDGRRPPTSKWSMTRRRQRTQDPADQPRRWIQSTEDRRADAQVGRAGRGAAAVQHVRNAHRTRR